MGKKLAYGLKELGVTQERDYQSYSNERLKEFRKQRNSWGIVTANKF